MPIVELTEWLTRTTGPCANSSTISSRGCTPEHDFFPSTQIELSDEGIQIDGLTTAERVVATKEQMPPGHR